jgi:hypothetical protein
LHHNSEDFAWDLNHLRQAQADGTLVFVLGAGVSKPYGLPDWVELLQQLLLHSGRLPRLRDRRGRLSPEMQHEEAAAIRRSLETLAADPLLQAAMIRRAYTSKAAWERALQQQLEARPGRKSPTDESLPLRAIARMLVDVAAADPGKHVPVLTFNFDALLEEALEAEVGARVDDGRLTEATKPRWTSVSTNEGFDAAKGAGIFIFHLHGFVRDLSTAEVAVDVHSYRAVLRDSHWSRSCLRTSIIESRATALFLGLSFTDPNLRFMLSDWAESKQELTGYYIAAPPPVPEASTLAAFRQLAFMSRTILDLYDEALGSLQLISYHLSSWNELNAILQSIDMGSA